MAEAGTSQTGTAGPGPMPEGLPEDLGLVELLRVSPTESGRTLLELLDEQPMLLIFLRHLGCMSARDAMHGVAQAQPVLEQRGVRPVFVHMARPERAQQLLERFGLGAVERVADPGMRLYRSPEFNLLRTTGVRNFAAPENYWKLAQRALRHGIGPARGEDATQLPGVFYLHDRAIYRAFRHKKISDRPDYARFGW